MATSNDTNQEPKGLMLKPEQYDRAKFATTIVLPGLGTLYFALAQIWGLPAGQQVLGTIIAVQAFLGVCLGISSAQYKNSDVRYSGDLNVIETPEKTTYSLNLNQHPDVLKDKSEVVFKVNPSEKPPPPVPIEFSATAPQ